MLEVAMTPDMRPSSPAPMPSLRKLIEVMGFLVFFWRNCKTCSSDSTSKMIKEPSA
jgi:hypothetical protein